MRWFLVVEAVGNVEISLMDFHHLHACFCFEFMPPSLPAGG